MYKSHWLWGMLADMQPGDTGYNLESFGSSWLDFLNECPAHFPNEKTVFEILILMSNSAHFSNEKTVFETEY